MDIKIVSWNCQEAFHNKYKKIRELDADVYVISEIKDPKNVEDDLYQDFMKNYYYLESKSKGLAIIAKEDIELKNNEWKYRLSNDFLSVRVNDSFNLVGVWTHEPYVDNVVKYLRLHKYDFINSDNLVMCGDFNIDVSTGNQTNKDMFAKILKSYGYKSIYHNFNNEEFGKESEPTIYWRRKKEDPYHVDYLFTNPQIISSFEIGKYDDYINYSDHMPLIFELDL